MLPPDQTRATHKRYSPGGILLSAFDARRPTVDIDALARGMQNDTETVLLHVQNISEVELDDDDGVEFLIETGRARVIRDDGLYSGVRVTMDARIATAQVKLQVDINFGDPITKQPNQVALPALRPDCSDVIVLGYPLETVLAEKIGTAIDLGPTNTRVRDFIDIYTLVGRFLFQFGDVQEALRATTGYRDAGVVPVSTAIGDLVVRRRSAYRSYRAGMGVFGAHLPGDFDEVVVIVCAFADPLSQEHHQDWEWNPALFQWVSRVPL